MSSDAHPLVLFDGVCNLCTASVQFVLARDPKGLFRFASLQSAVGRRLLSAHGGVAGGDRLDSVALIVKGRLYSRSGAALRIARYLRWPWPITAVFFLVPRFLRDGVYDWIARHRYRWFGRREACWLPSPSLHARFLDVTEGPGAESVSP